MKKQLKVAALTLTLLSSCVAPSFAQGQQCLGLEDLTSRLGNQDYKLGLRTKDVKGRVRLFFFHPDGSWLELLLIGGQTACFLEQGGEFMFGKVGEGI